MAEPMLSVYNINVWYGAIHAIKDISFNVNEGEIVALIGANGAGKSTTLKTISGLLRSKTGSIKFMGEDITHTPADKLVGKGLAQVPEGRRAFLQMTVEENLEMGAYTQPKSTVAPGLERVYEQFPRLKERRRQVAGTLSGGEQQMLVMGRALMSNPKLLMLDEPSMGLAPILIEQIFQIVEDLHKAGTTVLLVSHSMEDIAKYANRVLVMSNKKIAMYDTVEKVFARAPELLELGLSVPQVTKIFLKLREMGVDVPADVYTIPYAVKMILEAKRRREAGESLVLPREAKKEGGAAGC
jgi:branched-chain amino acid transport system ATP-binding protein